MVFDSKEPSFLDFFKKKSWLNTTEDFEKDIFKTLFKIIKFLGTALMYKIYTVY